MYDINMNVLAWHSDIDSKHFRNCVFNIENAEIQNTSNIPGFSLQHFTPKQHILYEKLMFTLFMYCIFYYGQWSPIGYPIGVAVGKLD